VLLLRFYHGESLRDIVDSIAGMPQSVQCVGTHEAHGFRDSARAQQSHCTLLQARRFFGRCHFETSRVDSKSAELIHSALALTFSDQRALALSYSTKTIAVAQGTAVQLMDTMTGLEIASLERSESSVMVVTFSPDDQWIASGFEDGLVSIDSLVDERNPKGVSLKIREFVGIVFTSQCADDLLAVFGTDACVLYHQCLLVMLNASTMNILYVIESHHDHSIHAWALSPDGDVLAWANYNHSIENLAEPLTGILAVDPMTGEFRDEFAFPQLQFQVSSMEWYKRNLVLGCSDGSVVFLTQSGAQLIDPLRTGFMDLTQNMAWGGLLLHSCPSLRSKAPYTLPKLQGTWNQDEIVSIRACSSVSSQVQDAQDLSSKIGNDSQLSINSAIEEVEHDEPAAIRDSEVLALQGDLDWADAVQQQIQESLATEDCIMPDAYVLSSDGRPLALNAISQGCSLLFAGIVKLCQELPTMLRRVTTLTYACSTEETQETRSLTITSGHVLPVRRGGRTFHRMKAKDLETGDHIRTCTGFAIIQSVDHKIVETSVMKVELQNATGKFFVGGQHSNKCEFVEVYADFPCHSHSVKILKFKRFDGFSALLEASELEQCRHDMSREGVSANLTEHGLGPGKIFVDGNIAWLVIEALNERSVETKCSEIIVDSCCEDRVLELVQRFSSRPRIIEPDVEILELPKHHVKNSFVEAGSSTGECSGVTKSTTDVEGNCCRNPRTAAAK